MDNELFDLQGKKALITGGSRGLGRQMALAFAKNGADVAIVSRKLDKCEEVVSEIEALGQHGFAYACHVGKWQDLEKMVGDVEANFGEIDILVNNAGLSPLYPSLRDVSEELFDKVVAINMKGPFRLMALIGSKMAERGNGGSIINVSSTASIAPSPGSQPYGAAKAGLNALTAAFAHEYGPSVRVNCIMAGPFLTDISKAWDMDAFGKRAERMALKRGGKPEEVIGAALYFASNASSFATGSVLQLDGGYMGNGE